MFSLPLRKMDMTRGSSIEENRTSKIYIKILINSCEANLCGKSKPIFFVTCGVRFLYFSFFFLWSLFVHNFVSAECSLKNLSEMRHWQPSRTVLIPFAHQFNTHTHILNIKPPPFFHNVHLIGLAIHVQIGKFYTIAMLLYPRYSIYICRHICCISLCIEENMKTIRNFLRCIAQGWKLELSTST